MIDTYQFVEHVIVPALNYTSTYSKSAVELLLGTAIQESRLRYLKQLGRGPALGVFQMEPRTHDDIWENYLRYKMPLAEKIAHLAHERHANSLKTDLLYAAAMCRAHYLRVPAALPAAGDFEGQAAYWKEHYNTYLGAGTEEEYLENWYAFSGIEVA